jgi:uncharacterized membrane protein HdeD (DUF308 family)
MNVLSPDRIAWLLPITILAHQLEEYFWEFPLWYSNLMNAQFSDQDFLIINGVGLFIFTVYALSFLLNKNKIILVALGTLVLVNGIIHLILTIFTWSYSPGTVTGSVLFLPLGLVIFKRISPQLRVNERIMAISIGILVLFAASMIAGNI